MAFDFKSIKPVAASKEGLDFKSLKKIEHTEETAVDFNFSSMSRINESPKALSPLLPQGVYSPEEQLANNREQAVIQDIEMRASREDELARALEIPEPGVEGGSNVIPVDELWGRVYQGMNDPEKRKSFKHHASTVQNVPEVEVALDGALELFKGDKGITDQTKLKSILLDVAKHESLGGRHLVQGGGGPARGAWQVEPATARDVLKTSGLFGSKAMKSLGKTKKEILGMSDDEMSKWLESFEVNAIFAIAKTLQASDSKGLLSSLKG